MKNTLTDQDVIDILTDPYNLNQSLNKIVEASGWKTSVQRMVLNKTSIFNQIRKDFTSGEPYRTKKAQIF